MRLRVWDVGRIIYGLIPDLSVMVGSERPGRGPDGGKQA
jgi:hypothetical protein